MIDEVEELLKAAGLAAFAATQFMPNCPPGIFAHLLLGHAGTI
jgi:hypothetical protein